MTRAIVAKVSASLRIVRLKSSRTIGDHVRRLFHLRDDALPYAPPIELNRRAVRGLDRALIPSVHPDMAWPVNPRSGRLAILIYQIQIPSKLGNRCRIRPYAILYALIRTGKICHLR